MSDSDGLDGMCPDYGGSSSEDDYGFAEPSITEPCTVAVTAPIPGRTQDQWFGPTHAEAATAGLQGAVGPPEADMRGYEREMVEQVLDKVVAVQTGDVRGVVLQAAQPIAAGELVLREVEIAFCPGYVDATFDQEGTRGTAAASIVGRWFDQLDDQQQCDVLSLCCPTPHQIPIPEAAAAFSKLAAGLSARHFRAVMAINSNACKTEGGPALYKLASRMNHSCDPSCCWYTETAVKGVPGPRAVRAVRNIAFGDEITISYSLHQLKTGPQSFLTQDLLDSKFFRCRCGRCTSPDLARAFRCPTEGCAALRHPWPESIGANAAAGPIFGTCSGCGSTSSQAEERRLLGVEARLSSNVRRVEGALKMGGGVANAKMMLGFLDREFAPDGDGSVTLHPGHWIAVKHQFLRYHACVFSTELPAAIAAIRLVVDHQRAIDPPSRQQAFDMEMLGDALLAHALSLSGDGDRDGFGAMSATATVEMLPWLLEAVATFRAELFLLQRINGPDHLYTTECRDKLKNAMAALHVFGGHTGVGDAASTVPPSPLTAADGEADHRLKCQGCVLDVCAAEVSLARLRVDDIRHRLERVSSTPKKTF